MADSLPTVRGIVPEAERLDCLMVIIPDRLSELVAKGEVVPRYYNPGNVFRRVHLVLTVDDAPDPALVQPMIGNAQLTLHSFPSGLRTLLLSVGWRPALLGRWAAPIVDLARRVRPQLVRCHGNHLNAFAAAEIRRRLGIPFLISLHCNPDEDMYFRGTRKGPLRWRMLGRAIKSVEFRSTREAELVLPVYSPIVDYLERHGVRRYEVVYNAVGYGVEPKRSYALDGNRVLAVCVGRQQSQDKDPSPILEALADVPEATLVLLGGGDLHERLRARAAALGLGDRVTFYKALPNAEVMRLLARADLFVYSTFMAEVSKAVIEAALTGLPIIHNERAGGAPAELVGPHVLLVPNTREAYRDALRRLASDAGLRESLGRAAREYALAHWSPEKTEGRVAAIYRAVVAASARPTARDLSALAKRVDRRA
jgi:glycosyltransferase involved in cell wall biosynthesis